MDTKIIQEKEENDNNKEVIKMAITTKETKTENILTIFYILNELDEDYVRDLKNISIGLSLRSKKD